MKDLDLAIPFDESVLNEGFFSKFLNKIKRAIKRFCRRMADIILALFGLIFLLPACMIVKYIYLRDKDYKSMFIFEDAIGKNGQVFKMIKFRSVNKDGTTNRLRRTALDNIPKIINVLRGEMTIVGPQPYLVKDKERMGTYYNRIIQMKPGITGISQISLIKDKSFESRLDNDIRYFYQKNLWTDLKILLITCVITLPTKYKGEVLGYLNLTIKDIGRTILKGINRFFKRLIDICGAIVGTAILIPLTVTVAIINFISGDKGPLFYSHERIGKNGKHFKMYKFRSMVVGADEILKELLENDEEARKEFESTRKLRNDPRITKIGNILRKTSLDEFPQFINVLKGEMSLVGPRAVVDGEIELFGKNKNIVLTVKPGITGYWAANGRSDTTYEERVKMETYYAKNFNCFFDIKILFKTVYSVIRKDGAV